MQTNDIIQLGVLGIIFNLDDICDYGMRISEWHRDLAQTFRAVFMKYSPDYEPLRAIFMNKYRSQHPASVNDCGTGNLDLEETQQAFIAVNVFPKGLEKNEWDSKMPMTFYAGACRS